MGCNEQLQRIAPRDKFAEGWAWDKAVRNTHVIVSHEHVPSGSKTSSFAHTLQGDVNFFKAFAAPGV